MMERLQYHLRRGAMIAILFCGICTVWGVGFLVAWGISDIISRFL